MAIFIVEDEENIRQLEGYALKNAGFEVLECASGQELFALLEQQTPQLVILDIMLPEQDGITILKKLRSRPQTKGTPVIIVSAKSQELDAVIGLDSGADDYITKPFGVVEFVSRVKAVLRRSAEPGAASSLSLGEIAMDIKRYEVTVGGQPCVLTHKEFGLLEYMLNNRGMVLTRDDIMTAVWGEDFFGESRTVDMHIKTLRQKLGTGGAHIKTVRNVGYKIE